MRAAVVILVVLVIIGVLVFTPVRMYALDLVRWVQAQGPAAAVLYALVYAIAAVAFLPASALTLGAGFVYGVVWGTLLVVPASIAAALAAFAVARRLARRWVERKVASKRTFAALDRAIGRAGFKITLLVRLSPIFPYGLLNYGLGVTSVRFRDYAIASAIGMLPGTVLYVYLGSLAASINDLHGHTSRGWLYWVGGAITLIVTVAVTWIARRELHRELEETR